jgi:hypothetical protein
MPIKKNLADKQRLFIAHYIETLNATEAARLAGYKGDNAALGVTGNRTLRNAKVRLEINRQLAKQCISAEELLARVTKHATGSMGDFVTLANGLDGIASIELDLVKAYQAGKFDLVKKLTETTFTTIAKDGETKVTKKLSVELYPADAAQDRLMRYHSLFNDRITVTYESEIKELILSGRISREEVEQEIGIDFARELFESIGVSVG